MINPAIINAFADGCTPRVLVVTDMSFAQGGNGFSLWQFVDTLLKAGMKVTRANLRNADGEPQGTLLNFKFDDPNDGLSRERYDVCFIFPFSRDGSWGRGFGILLPNEDVNAIENFMEEGGGVFATGDHEDLGAGICRNIIRVRNMRKWTRAQGVPSQSGPDRLSTMLSGDDELYEFADESDIHPQRLFLNRNTVAGGAGNPHPLMQAQNGRAIVHIPDHPHEGECIIPEDLETTFELDGENKREWPLEIGGNDPISPEIVAKSMSAGGPLFFPLAPGEVPGGPNDTPKAIPIPREFIAIAAYDGHRAGVGRVVTDATWHHFLDINIDGTGARPRPDGDGAPRHGLRGNGADDSPVMMRLRQHWRNLAEWLIPQDRRNCASIGRIAEAMMSFPLIEELNIPAPENRDASVAAEVGSQIMNELKSRLMPFQVNELMEDVMAMGGSDKSTRKAGDENAAVGALAMSLVDMGKEKEMPAEEMRAKIAEAVAASVTPEK
jgi:hypothetical protein